MDTSKSIQQQAETIMQTVSKYSELLLHIRAKYGDLTPHSSYQELT
jgi:hypothetical protein